MKLKHLGYAAFVAATAVAFVIGSTGSSLAKKKKEEAPAATHVTCFLTSSSPVCGDKGGARTTYRNSCWAEKDDAKVVSNKACPEKKAKAAAAKPAKKKKAM